MAEITLTPEVQAVARKFLERLRDEGYNAEQLAEAARTWTHDYARGLRNPGELESRARKSSALPESFVTENPYENTPELLTEQFERDLRIAQPGLSDEQIATELEGFAELPLDAMGGALGLDPGASCPWSLRRRFWRSIRTASATPVLAQSMRKCTLCSGSTAELQRRA